MARVRALVVLLALVAGCSDDVDEAVDVELTEVEAVRRKPPDHR